MKWEITLQSLQNFPFVPHCWPTCNMHSQLNYVRFTFRLSNFEISALSCFYTSGRNSTGLSVSFRIVKSYQVETFFLTSVQKKNPHFTKSCLDNKFLLCLKPSKLITKSDASNCMSHNYSVNAFKCDPNKKNNAWLTQQDQTPLQRCERSFWDSFHWTGCYRLDKIKIFQKAHTWLARVYWQNHGLVYGNAQHCVLR